MTTTRTNFTFAGGEVAPSIWSRPDLIKYQTGARKLRNFLVAKAGGAQNRPGFTYVTEVKDSNVAPNLVPFIFGAGQTYLMEFGHLYIRFHQDGAPVEVSDVDDWDSLTAYVIGDLALYNSQNYYCIANNTNQAPAFSGSWYLLTEGIYEVPTPYTEDDLEELQARVQSADVVTITHPSHDVMELSRTGHTTWILSEKSFAPTIAAPTAPSVSGTAGSTAYTYHITSVKTDPFEESLAVTKTSGNLTAPATNAHTITWTEEDDAEEYNIYLEVSGVPGFVGTARGDEFIYDGEVEPDTTDTPPTARNPFSGDDNKPSTATYSQGRIILANTNNRPETFFTSRSGSYGNFTISSPTQEDDAVTATLAGQQVNEIRHLLPLARLIAFTGGAEWVVFGDADGNILPNSVNAKPQSYNGCSILHPLVINGDPIYVQARAALYGSVVRTFGFQLDRDGYRGEDMTVFASHLFEGFTLRDWDYQQLPNSIVWAVRSGGKLLGLTYIPEHQIWGWHQHDTRGEFEKVCVVPEGTEDAVYVVVKRTINGNTRRYIERMATRYVDADAVEDGKYMDSILSYDGRKDHSIILTGSGWTSADTLTATSSESDFASGDVGNEVHITDSDGGIVRCAITAYTSSSVVSVVPDRTVPADLQATPTSDWSLAVDQVSGLEHLEGETVSVFADGVTVANPNNPGYTALTVSGGSITLPRCYGVIHVGLPYTSDLETLDIDSAQSTRLDKKKMVNSVIIPLEKSRGLWAGPALPDDDLVGPGSGLTEAKVRNAEGYDEPVSLLTQTLKIDFEGEWNDGGRVVLRQSDPVPCTILGIAPAGYL